MLALATLVKFVILKQGFRNISKRITSLIFLNITLHRNIDLYNSPSFKIIDKTNSKFDLKIKELINMYWRKLKCTTKSFSSHTFTIACITPLFLSVFFVLLSLSCIIFIISNTNYQYLLLS